MSHSLLCWRCGHSLATLSLPLSRLDECPACSITLHVCKMCVHYDRHAVDQCRLDDADYVKEKERPNFCDYFTPSELAHDPGGGADDAARQELEQLFGGAGGETSASVPDPLESLFKKPDC